MSELFTSSEQPAPDVRTLLDYLRQGDGPQYLYRGQVQDYASPLLSSAYRGKLDTSKRFDSNSPQYQHRLRKIGKQFVGNYVTDVRQLSHSAADERRRRVRQLLLDSFGYTLGSVLAQHYGLKSELLDVTREIDVAAFFATRHAPGFRVLTSPTSGLPLGVIYRFMRLDAELKIADILERTFRSAPGTFVLSDLLESFEADVSISESLDSIRCAFEVFCATGYRPLDVLKLPKGVSKVSRVGQQRAAVIVPDLIYARTFHTSQFADPIAVRNVPDSRVVLQAVEDLEQRDGTMKFYFCHTDQDSAVPIAARSLWPNHDDPLISVVALFASGAISTVAGLGADSDWSDLIDSGPNPLDVPHAFAPCAELCSVELEYDRTIRYSEYSPTMADRVGYYISKAASMCRSGSVTKDKRAFQSAVRLCGAVKELDGTRNVVLLLLEGILYALMQEERLAQRSWEQAYALAETEDMFLMISQIFEHMNGNTTSPDFEVIVRELYFRGTVA